MPRVEKTRGGRVYIRPLDEEFMVGDQATVGDDLASHLVDERGDFEVVDDAGDGDGGQEDEPPDEQVDGDDEDVEICGEEMSDGEVCERPADECPYHGDEED